MVKSGVDHKENYDLGTGLSRMYSSPFILKKNVRDGNICMKNRSDFDKIFICLGNRQNDVIEADMNAIESFALKMYTKMGRTSLTDLQSNMFIFLTDNDLRKLPAGRRALKQYTRRACYQVGYAWQELVSDLALSNHKNWGWVFEGNTYQPRWKQENCPITIEMLTC